MVVADIEAHRRAVCTWDDALAGAMVKTAQRHGVRMTREGLAVVQAVVDGVCWVVAACLLMACTTAHQAADEGGGYVGQLREYSAYPTVVSVDGPSEPGATSPDGSQPSPSSAASFVVVPEIIVRAPKPRAAPTVWEQPEPRHVTYCDPNALGGVTCETY
jgi:hypothetical protein